MESLSTRAAYREIGGRASGKTDPAQIFSRGASLQALILCRMVRIHRITPELALSHVSQMNRSELLRRWKMYAGMELSAVAPHLEGSTCLPKAHAPDDDGMAKALNPVPENDPDSPPGIRPGHARVGEKELGPQPGAVCPARKGFEVFT